MDIMVLSIIPEISLPALNPTAVVFQVSFALWHLTLSLSSIFAFIELKFLTICYDNEQIGTWGSLLRWLSKHQP